jgi:hypothetical protein
MSNLSDSLSSLRTPTSVTEHRYGIILLARMVLAVSKLVKVERSVPNLRSSRCLTGIFCQTNESSGRLDAIDYLIAILDANSASFLGLHRCIARGTPI